MWLSGFEMCFGYFYRISTPYVPGGSQPKHVSNPAYRSVNTLLCRIDLFAVHTVPCSVMLTHVRMCVAGHNLLGDASVVEVAGILSEITLTHEETVQRRRLIMAGVIPHLWLGAPSFK